jgi:hypothetical protein
MNRISGTSHLARRKTTLRLRTLAQAGLLASTLAFGSAAQAALSFVFDYGDNDGTTEFLGAQNQYRRDALETAGTLFSNYFGSLFANSGTITLGVQGTNQGCANGCTLAFATSNSVYSGAPGFGGIETVRNKLQGGGDINGAANDGLVGVNWGAPWELDPNVSVAAQGLGNFDFYAALFHEFTHALGFASVPDAAGTDGSPAGGITLPGYWNKFDQFTTDCQGTDLIDHGTLLTSPVYADASVSANGKSMCFAGANALAANGGAAVPLYAPTTYAPGSSGSHLLEQGPNTGAMMKFDRDANIDEARTYNPITIGILMDIGYAVAALAVPEPGSIALVLAALGLASLARRKRNA